MYLGNWGIMGRGIVHFYVFSKMFKLYPLGAPFTDQPKPAFLWCLVSLELRGGQLFMLLRLHRCLWWSLWNPVLGVGESSSVWELGWMAGDSDCCVRSAHTRLLAYELEPLLHDLNAPISIFLFRIYLPQITSKVYFVTRLSVCADTEIMCRVKLELESFTPIRCYCHVKCGYSA